MPTKLDEKKQRDSVRSACLHPAEKASRRATDNQTKQTDLSRLSNGEHQPSGSSENASGKKSKERGSHQGGMGISLLDSGSANEIAPTHKKGHQKFQSKGINK
jgi:hypothetical protein